MNIPAEISNRAAECLQLLERWRREDASGLPSAENAVFLFRLWAANNFVFTNDRMCLDWRLRNVAVLASVVRDLLDSFKTALSSKLEKILDREWLDLSGAADILETVNHPGLPHDADNDHLAHNLAQTDDFQTRLFDICRAIHRSGVLSRLSKVASYRELLEFDGKLIDLSEHFRASIETIVEKRHPKASKSTRLRLVDSISLRRQNFSYLRDREVKASEALGKRMSAFGSHGVSSLLPLRPAGASAASGPADVLKLNSKRRRSGVGPTSTIFTASTANVQRVFKTHSVRTSSTFLESKYHAIDGMMPRPPKPMDDSGYIKCPYCFLVCSTNELQGKFWKRHFIQDLMPYVCMLDGCSMPDTLFESFGDWTAHMANQHSTTIWTCTNRSHGTPSRFYSRTDFEAHLRDEHKDEFEESDLEELVESSAISRPRREPLTDCPLCLDDFDAKSMPLNDILNHVAEHMISLALLSLPEDENREPTNSEGFASGTSSTIQTRVSAVSSIAKAMETSLSVDTDEIEIEDDELSTDLIEIPELAPTDEDQWNQFWEGNPLPICTTPEASLLRAFEYHPGPETSAETQHGEAASAGLDQSESHPDNYSLTLAAAPVPNTSNGSDEIDIDAVLDRLLEARNTSPGKQEQRPHPTIVPDVTRNRRDPRMRNLDVQSPGYYYEKDLISGDWKGKQPQQPLSPPLSDPATLGLKEYLSQTSRVSRQPPGKAEDFGPLLRENSVVGSQNILGEQTSRSHNRSPSYTAAEPTLQKAYDIYKVREELEREPERSGLAKYFKSPKVDGYLQKFIADRDMIFIVDNGDTMGPFWKVATYVLETLAMKLAPLDEDGLDLVFTIGHEMPFNAKGKNAFKEFRKQMDRAAPSPVRDSSGEKRTNMAETLGRVFTNYTNQTKSKRMTLLVLTDGRWRGTTTGNTVEDKIATFVKNPFVHKYGLEDRWFSISFIQFGEDPDASKRLKWLDDELSEAYKIPGIIDHVSWTGSVTRMILGSFVEDMDEEDETAFETEPTSQSRVSGFGRSSGEAQHIPANDNKPRDSLPGGFPADQSGGVNRSYSTTSTQRKYGEQFR
ncbi:hypothetical protein CLAIMM_12832 [Cladophialophora immunda]|nr:hypothetical protein CLAIMM_12832 [Cladophialophora immunda]